MPITLPTANQGGDAPKFEDGLALARFDDLLQKSHPDWAGTDQYGHADDGERFHFVFTMLDEDRAVVYDEGEDPIVLEATTRLATGAKSNFAAVLKGILTAAEFALWEANEGFDGAALAGRIVNVTVAHSKKGWPFIEATHGQPKSRSSSKGKAD